MNLGKIAIVARYTVLEAMHARTLHVGAAALAAWLALTLFLGELAITESVRMRTALFAGGARLLIVFIVCLHVAHAVTREHADRTLELILGRPVSRYDYYLGKFAGYTIIALLLAATAASVTVAAVPGASALVWGAGLALESFIAIALTLFAAGSLGHLLPAMALSIGFYVLARTGASIVHIAHASKVTGDGFGTRSVFACAEMLARAVPDLSRFASTAGLLGESSQSTLGYAAMQALLYSVILLCAGMLDLRRKDL